MDKVDQHFDQLLRLAQVDLSELDRERLEEITLGLIEGQIAIVQALGAETKHSQVINSQREIISGLQEQVALAQQTLASANEALGAFEDTEETYYRDMIMAMAQAVMDDWEEQEFQKKLLLGLWQGLRSATNEGMLDKTSDLYQGWSQMIEQEFTPPTEAEAEDEVQEAQDS